MGAYLWTPDSGVALLGVHSSAAFGVSADGGTVVGRFLPADDNEYEAFRWTTQEGMVGLGDLPGGIHYSEARAVSGDAAVIVGTSYSDRGYEAIRWTQAGGMVPIGGLAEGEQSIALDVSLDGASIVGGVRSEEGSSEAFIWTEPLGMMRLGDLPGGSLLPNSEAMSVSADGSVVVGRAESDGGIRGFRWTSAEGMVDLGRLTQSAGYGIAVSPDGKIVVGTFIRDGMSEPFVWDEVNGMQQLDQILYHYGINVSGYYLGLPLAIGISESGYSIAGENFFATIPAIPALPEPNTIILLGAGLTSLAAWNRRRA